MSSFLSFGADLADGAAATGPSIPEPVDADAATPEVEREIVADLLRKAVPVAPVVLLACTLIWGADGFFSSLFGLALILGNLLVAAASLSWAARRSQSHLMGVALFGFIARMAVLVLAVELVKDQPWVSLGALGTTILVTYLGLLVWETRFVSASLAFPGLKPGKQTTTEDLS